MDLVLIGGGILLLYWMGTSAGSQAPGPGQTGTLSPSSAIAITPAGVLQDIGQVVGQVSTVVSIGRTVISAPSQISKAVSALVGPSAPSPPTAEFSLFTQGPFPQEILPANLVDATEFIPSAEQAISAGAEILIPEAFEFFGSISEGAGGALSLSQVAGEVPILWAGAPVAATAAEEAASVLGAGIASGFGAGEEAASVLGVGAAAAAEEAGVLSTVLAAVAPFAYGVAALSVPLIALVASGGLKEMTTPPEDAMTHDLMTSLQWVQAVGGWDAALNGAAEAYAGGSWATPAPLSPVNNPIDRITGYYLTTTQGMSGAYVPIELFPVDLIPKIQAYIPTYLTHVAEYEAARVAAIAADQSERYP
jgi:hypothetical protein